MEKGVALLFRVCDIVRKAVDLVLDSVFMSCNAGSGPNVFCTGRLNTVEAALDSFLLVTGFWAHPSLQLLL